MQTGLEAAKNPDSEIHAAPLPPALGKAQPKQDAAATTSR